MNDKELFAKRLTEYRYKAGMSQKDLAEKSGISLAQISRYETGLSMPRPQSIVALSNALKVETSMLMSGKPNRIPNPPIAGQLLNYIRTSDRYSLENIARKLNISLSYLRQITLGEIVPPPELIDNIENFLSQTKKVHNIPLIMWDDVESFLTGSEKFQSNDFVAANIDASKYVFALKIKGDAMLSKHGNISIPNNSFVVFDKFFHYFSGDLVLVKFNNGDMAFKMLIKDTGMTYLSSLNDNYKPIVISMDEVKILAKAVQVIINIPRTL